MNTNHMLVVQEEKKSSHTRFKAMSFRLPHLKLAWGLKSYHFAPTTDQLTREVHSQILIDW